MALNPRYLIMWFIILIHILHSDGFNFYTKTLSSPIVRLRRSLILRSRPSSYNSQKSPTTDMEKLSFFSTENCTVVVAQIGGTAALPCVVRKFSNGVISWIRKHDYQLLTVGLATYNTDDRFMVEHVRHLQNWGLLIRNVQMSDAGLYECQISTHPPTSIIIDLKVTKASAEIQGSPDLHLRMGSQLRLVCTVRHSTEAPAYVFWYHEHRMINYDPGVEVKEGQSSSVLQLQTADSTNNGNYTCSPSNAVPASITVHVLNATAEEKSAVMQQANSSPSSSTSLIRYFILLMMIVPTFSVT